MRHLIPDSVVWLADAAVPVLIDSSLKGVVLLLIAGLIVRLLGKSSADVRHTIWVMAVGGLAVLPLLSVVMPAWRVVPGVLHWSATNNVMSERNVVANQKRDAQSTVAAEPVLRAESFETVISPKHQPQRVTPVEWSAFETPAFLAPFS